jgi:hypothetical protein
LTTLSQLLDSNSVAASASPPAAGIVVRQGDPKEMANRKGVFIGAYVPNELKESLRRRAAAEHRTLSQEITRILTEAIHGRNLPPGSIDRRAANSPTRRRASDPFPRRRRDDLPYAPTEGRRGEDKS